MVGQHKYFEATFPTLVAPRLELVFSKDIAAMPGSDGLPGRPDVLPDCLVVDSNGYFDVVSYLYTSEGVRHFTNGDMLRAETTFVAWALLPDLK